MKKALYRSLLKFAREADADPALKQEIIRKSHPLIQASTIGLNHNLLNVNVSIDDMNAHFILGFRDVVVVDKNGDVDEKNKEVIARHPDYGVDKMHADVLWDAKVLAKTKDGSVSLKFKDNDKCTWKADEIEKAVFAKLPLATYILNNPKTQCSSKVLVDGEHSDIIDDEYSKVIDVLAVGGFYGGLYGGERFQKWYRGKCKVPTLSHYARPNYFASGSKVLDNDDNHMVNGGGMSFTWYCRLLFRRKLQTLLESSSALSDQVISKKNEEEEVEIDQLFELLALIQSAHNSVYGGSTSSLYNKKHGQTDPIWLRYVKEMKKGEASQTSYSHNQSRLWSVWGAKLTPPPSLKELNSSHSNDEGDDRYDRWSEFEVVNRLLSANAELISAYERGDIKGICRVWGFDSNESITKDSNLRDVKAQYEACNSALYDNHLVKHPTCIAPGWNGVSYTLKGYTEIKEYYEKNFAMRQSKIEIFIDNIETHIGPSNLSGITTTTLRVEVPKYAGVGSNKNDAEGRSNLVSYLLISNSFQRSKIGESFTLIHQHTSLTN